MVVVMCFLTALFWSHVAAVSATGAIMLEALVAVTAELFVVLYLVGIMLWRTFLSGRIKMMYNCREKEKVKSWPLYSSEILSRWITFGLNRQAIVTDADRLIVTDIEVILNATLFPVPKYRGTNASHITHVVYIVKPVEIEIRLLRV